MAATCASCGAPILWATTRQGARMPLDPWIDPEGNCATTIVAGTLLVRVHPDDQPTLEGM